MECPSTVECARNYSNKNIGISLTLDMKQWESLSGGSLKQDPPPREVTQSKTSNTEWINCHTSADIPFGEEEWTSLFEDMEALERSMQDRETKGRDE